MMKTPGFRAATRDAAWQPDMSDSTTRPPGDIRHTPKGKKPRYFQDPATDKLLSMVMTLAEELSVTRDRLDTVEQLLSAQGVLPPAAVEAFEPDPAVESAREARRSRFVNRLLSALRAELEDATDPDFPDSRKDILKQLD